jgi:stearoyl-CoA desaturase (delta-9 desaturase)
MSLGSKLRFLKSGRKDFQWVNIIPHLGMHLAAIILVALSGFSWIALAVCLFLYGVRMFGITAGFHRYFAHRSYKTSRWFQFVLAWLGCSAAQLGPIWWAGHHRDHHKYSDTEKDVHSPVVRNFWWSHMGWLFSDRFNHTPSENMKDFHKYPEIMWLDKFSLLPPVLLAVATFFLGRWLAVAKPEWGTSGMQMLAWGFFASTVLLYHGTFTVNSVAHLWGKKVYPSKDESRNNPLIALITLGEGWHNNHHFFPSSEAQGLEWWQFDVSHYTLKALSWVGITWDLKKAPRDHHKFRIDAQEKKIKQEQKKRKREQKKLKKKQKLAA